MHMFLGHRAARTCWSAVRLYWYRCMSTRTSTARVAAARPRSPLPFPRAPQVKRLACCDVPCQGRGAHAMPRDAHTSPKSVRGQVAYEDVRRSRRLQREGRVVIAACLRRDTHVHACTCAHVHDMHMTCCACAWTSKEKCSGGSTVSYTGNISHSLTHTHRPPHSRGASNNDTTVGY